MKVALDSLGCKLNQAETELLAKQFTEAGYSVVSSVNEADIYVLNTCTVTRTADAKSRHLLRLAHRQNSNALVVATGCYAQRASQELAQIEGISLVVGNDEKPHLMRLLQESGCFSSPNPGLGSSADNRCPALRTRTFVKIQDGCNNYCSYCVVPLVRGKEKSLPVDQIIDEIKHRVANGYKEVVLTGTEIGLYSYAGVNLKGLLERILAKTDITRLRLSSLQPQEISPELVGLWHDKRLCPHFHISLQSGSDRVLRQMNRRYCVSDYQGALSLIRDLVPEVAITTDIIVGFPGETDAEFEESYELCRWLGFARIHVFPYSPRNGTQASQLTSQISDKVKKQRSRKMLALAKESAQNFKQRYLGRVMPVLWEKQADDGVWSGLTDNYIRISVKSSEELTNKVLPAKIA
ncbi:tRNA (N(6)-L-threonylcarbamoyladenosine(37)-C(2))-methylthiotransferase MtaB [Chloroflexota bacterium]